MSISKQPLKKTPVKRRSVTKPAAPVKVFDVARPGKTVADSTSRSLIITNHPVMQDPMVTVRSDAAEPEVSSAPPLKPVKKLVITPLHQDIVPAKTVIVEEPMAAPGVPATALPAKAVITQKETAAVPAITDIEAPIVAPQPVPAKPDAEPGVPLNINDPTTKSVTEDTVISQQRAAELRQLIDDERYFLPVNTVESKRSKRFAIAGLLVIIVLAVAWYDVALDAGLVTNAYNLPHTTFLVKN